MKKLIKEKTRLIFSLFSCVWMVLGTGISAEKKYTIYKSQVNDSVEIIARKFLSRHQQEYGKHIEEYISDLKFWNPHVKNWKRIPEHTEIYIDFPYPPYPAPPLNTEK